MPKVYIREVVLSWASERRRHHNGGAQEVYTNSATPGTVSPGNQYAVQPPGTTIGWTEGTTPRTGNFAYMTIGGGTNGAVFYSAQDLARGTTIDLVPVGENDINIVMIYLPVGTGGTTNPTVFVDAFNVSTGQFVDN